MKLSELLEDLLLKINELDAGLCFLNLRTNKEDEAYYKIFYYLKDNKPLTLRTISHPRKNVYWWKPGLVEPRKKWLKKHIKKLKAKGL
jgi:hypothetical protein